MSTQLPKNEQGLRMGYTTGSCAAAAAVAAAQMLLGEKEVSAVKILTPKGIELSLDIEDIDISVQSRSESNRVDFQPVLVGAKQTSPRMSGTRENMIKECENPIVEDDFHGFSHRNCEIIEQSSCERRRGDCTKMSRERVRCGVRKDAGDDPDITDGIYVYAVAERTDASGIQIAGGIGVGRVTRPGLDQPVGAAAINHVPREMIAREVSRVMEQENYGGGIRITIEIPEGVALAAKTFNPRLGIEGGISVLGTSGIVEPMSEDALKATIRAELSVRRAEGHRNVILVPGNYGLDFLREKKMSWNVMQNEGDIGQWQEYPELDADTAVKCSNFIGDAIEMAAFLGFSNALLVGHIGKLIKLSGGIFNTHSRQADARIDLLVSAGVRAGVSGDILRLLFDAVTTEDALRILDENRVLRPVMDVVKERVAYYLKQRAGENLQIRAILFSNVYGEL